MFFVQVALILFSVQVIMNFVQKQEFVENSFAISVALGFLSWIIAAMMEIGLIKLALNAVRGKKLVLEELYANQKYIFNFMLANIITGLISFVGFILLIIPGIIWSLKFMFYGYFVIDKDAEAFSSLSRSSDITDGEKMNLFGFVLYCLGFNLLGALCFLVGLLFTVPATVIATAYVFEKLAGVPAPVEVPKVEMQNAS